MILILVLGMMVSLMGGVLGESCDMVMSGVCVGLLFLKLRSVSVSVFFDEVSDSCFVCVGVMSRVMVFIMVGFVLW